MQLPPINLNLENLSQFEKAIQKEWIITNGLGGYASSTALGINTRKYHGLLIASLNPPIERTLCLAKLDEDVNIEGNTYPLGTNEFQNGFFPQGYGLLKEFSISPSPKYVYSVANVRVEKTIFMPHEKNATVVIYEVSNKNNRDVKVQIFPLTNCRHIHAVTDKWKTSWNLTQKEKTIHFNTPKCTLIIGATNGHFNCAPKWIEKIYYREEEARGESCFDDCYQPGYFEIAVKANKSESFAVFAVAAKGEENAHRILAEMPTSVYDAEGLLEREAQRTENFLTKFYEKHASVPKSNWLSWVAFSTDAFIVRGLNTAQKFIIAGYHWFGVWGRDAFVSLPGLMLVTGRFEDARKVFLTFKTHYSRGLIPNFLSEENGSTAYNAVDATLWLVNATLQYLKYTGDFRFVQEQLWETLKGIVENHVKGTLFNIHLDSDGLLAHDSQLTWMDTAINGQPVTPRAGKAVEVQALWYNALKTMELLAHRFKEKRMADEYAQIAERAKVSFNEKFWNANKNCLFDTIGEHGEDDSLRPNQIIAVSLDFTMLDNTKKEKIVDAVHHELLTPYGLRTLARNHPKYVGAYIGDRKSRDKAYHNGTVWPWLLGPFTTAFLKVKGYSDYRREYALSNFLSPLFSEQIFKAGLGMISEIFDGEPPHTPRGCIAQAWSVAEPLRAYIEDIMQIRPKYEREVLQGLG
ncbi:MAG: amylo-alpha-1,6-glucosidase [Candidatus Bathyarchaeia archaeon]